MSELERLRGDLEVLERYFCDGCARVVQDKIAEIEKAAADPWREAKGHIENWRQWISGDMKSVIAYIDHLTAENASLEKRVAELEKEDAADVVDAEAALAKGEFVPLEDMQPPFEGPIESIELVLDPARVLATARKWFIDTDFGRHNRETIAEVIQILGIQLGSRNAKPYRLKGGGR